MADIKYDRYGDPIYPGQGVRVMMVNGRPVVEDPVEALEGTLQRQLGSSGTGSTPDRDGASEARK